MLTTQPVTSKNQKITKKKPTAVGLPAVGPPGPCLPSVVRDHSDSTTSSISDEEEEDQKIALSSKIRFKKKRMGSSTTTATAGVSSDNERNSQKECQKQNGGTNQDGKTRISISNSTPPSSPGRLSPHSRRSERRRRRTSIDLSQYLECSLSSPSYDPDDDGEDNIYSHNHNNNHNRMNRSSKIYQRIVGFLASSLSVSDVVEKITHIHYFWTSPVLLRMYTAVFVAVAIRQYWVLQTISVMIVMRMVAIVTQWGLFAWKAPNFRRVKSMVLWWVNFGLGLATKSASDGPSIHRFVTSVSVTVAKGIGKDITVGAIKGITEKNRQKVLSVAKENMKLVNGRTQKD